MGNQPIALHLADAQTALRSTAARRLMRPLFTPSLAARIPLVLRHVLQAHAEDGSNENGRRHLNTRRAIIQEVIARLFKTKLPL